MNDFDDLSKFERHETKKKLPLGWVIMAIGLVAFGVYYLVAYTPTFSGWSQVKEYEESLEK